MIWFLRSLLFSTFYRLLNGFLLLFFLVHVVRAGSVIRPVRETVHAVAGWWEKVNFRQLSQEADAPAMLRRRFD